jgi:hypothetical protein
VPNLRDFSSTFENEKFRANANAHCENRVLEFDSLELVPGFEV